MKIPVSISQLDKPMNYVTLPRKDCWEIQRDWNPRKCRPSFIFYIGVGVFKMPPNHSHQPASKCFNFPKSPFDAEVTRRFGGIQLYNARTKSDAQWTSPLTRIFSESNWAAVGSWEQSRLKLAWIWTDWEESSRSLGVTSFQSKIPTPSSPLVSLWDSFKGW